jgi:O-antigen/teichoic acid export membrane protein
METADAARMATAQSAARINSIRVLIGRAIMLAPPFGPFSGNGFDHMAQRTQRLIEAARRPMPEGTFVVGAGLLVAGLSAYGFQILTYRALVHAGNEADYNAVNGLWVLVFVLAPGFFLPLEQEVGRALADRRVKGMGGGPVVRRASLAGLILTIGLAILAGAAAFGTPLVDDLFKGHDGLAACLVIGLFTYCVQHLARGTLSGNGRFGSYGLLIGAEGVIRLMPVAVLAAIGVDNPVWYGLSLAVPPVIAAGIALSREKGLLAPGPPAPWSELSSNLGFLFFGSLSAQVLGYAPFLGALMLAKDSQDKAVANFLAGVFLARIPILLFQAVQAALLPKLAGLAGAGRHDDFRTGLRKLVLIVVGIGVIGAVAAGTLGPPVGEILFGEKFSLGHADLAYLATGSGLFILALTLAQGLIALMGHSRVLLAWLVGIAGFAAVTAVASDNVFTRVELGFIAGAGASAVAMSLLLVARMRAGVPDDDAALARLAEQIEHEPLEI